MGVIRTLYCVPRVGSSSLNSRLKTSVGKIDLVLTPQSSKTLHARGYSFARNPFALLKPLHSTLFRLASPNIQHRWFPAQQSVNQLTFFARHFATMSSGSQEKQNDEQAFVSKPIPIPQDEPTSDLVTRRIHLMGLGSIGTFIGHGLKTIPNPPPMTLLFHRPGLYDDFEAKNWTISVVNNKTKEKEEARGYDVDLFDTESPSDKPYWKFIADKGAGSKAQNDPRNKQEILPSGETYISNLIVTVKGPATKSALRSLKHRIDAKSTICLIQNGMGQVDELNDEVFTDPATRPTYVLGIIAYGVYLDSNFAAVHAGTGATSLGVVKSNSDGGDQADLTKEILNASPGAQFMVKAIAGCEAFDTSAYKYQDLLQLQLEKLCMNTIMNPLTAILNIRNGFLRYNEHIAEIHQQLLQEFSQVICNLPEFKGVPNISARFSPGRLGELLFSVSTKTAANSSSMREDVLKARGTEVDYINGYIVKRGDELGIDCVYHRMMLRMIKGKSLSQKAEAEQNAATKTAKA